MISTSERAAVPLPATLAASVAPGWRDLTVGGHASVSMDIGAGRTLSVAHLLQAFEALRRELSRHLIGTPGVFVGYDSLTLPQAAVRGPQQVLIEARLLGQTDRLHEVQYTALSVSVPTTDVVPCDPVLAHGTGRTLHVHT